MAGRKNTKEKAIVIYRAAKGPELKVHLEKETVWLTQSQIALLFGTQRPAITKHLNNIFKMGELDKKSVSSILEHTAADGKRYKTQFYNLDAIISVGYRVNSKLATQFRVWATRTLKEYLVRGYAINEKRLLETKEKFNELQRAIAFLKEKSENKLLTGQEKEILNLLADYSKTLSILEQYDNGKLLKPRGRRARFVIKYDACVKIIGELRKELVVKKEASDLFGNEVGDKFKSVVGNLYQTFNSRELYKTLGEKAAHLFYLTIKDHPFSDGNKRIASFLFVYFLDRNNFLYRKNGERKINDNALIALALLIAESEPREKETMVKIIMNLIAE